MYLVSLQKLTPNLYKMLMDGFIPKKSSLKAASQKQKCQIWWWPQWSLKIWTVDMKSWCHYYWKSWRAQPNSVIPAIVNPTYRWVLDDDKPNLISCQHIIQRNRAKRLCWSHYEGRFSKGFVYILRHVVEHIIGGDKIIIC